MNKFITVTCHYGSKILTYSFNVSNIIYIAKGDKGQAVIYHIAYGNGAYCFQSIESYEDVMKMINK